MLTLRRTTSPEQKKIVKRVRQMLLPAPSPLAQWLERLIMLLLPRKFEAVSLIPESQIKVINADIGEYNALADHPYFQLIADSGNQSAGWYYLEVALVRHGGNRIANLYFDAGRGYCKEDSIFVPSNRRGSVGEVLYLPKGLLNLRWSPMETSGRFTQSPLLIHRISLIESIFRRAWRVGFDLLRMRHLSIDERAGMSWSSLVLDLNVAYAWSANIRRANSAAVAYPTFIKRNDTILPEDESAITKHIPLMANKPLLSIIMPIDNPDADHLRSALDSLMVQKYPHWELCIASDTNAPPSAREIIATYVAQDRRVKSILHTENGNVCVALNTALNLAQGEFIARMNQGDVLPIHALYHVVVEINRFPEAQMIYSDEDKLNDSGIRTEPHFKSDWNPDLFFSQNMSLNLGVYRTALVREVGGFRSEYEGAHDYDLALRCAARIHSDAIRHIPRVLYHARVGSYAGTPLNIARSDASSVGLRALQDHFSTTSIQVEQTEVAGLYRVRYPLPEKRPLVTLIIPTRDQVDVLRKCIESIQTLTDYPNFEVLVLDNQSRDPDAVAFLATVEQDQRFKVIPYDAPFNYSAINNYAVTLASGEIIGLINNDIEVISKDWLSEMVSHVVRPEVGAVGAKLLYSNGTVQHAGVILGYGGLAGHAHKFFDNEDVGYFGRASVTQTLSAVTAACLLVRKDVYAQVGGLDEKNLTVAFNDVDFCIKVREAGYRNIYTPYALLYHHESISRGQENTPEKQARHLREVEFMQKKWGDLVKVDPFYNPNLILTAENFSLANHTVHSAHHGYPLNLRH